MEWKDIPGYEGFYQVSKDGQVKSKDIIIIRKDGKPYSRKSKILKPFYDKDGYLRIELNKVGNCKKFYVHRLVAMTFLENRFNKEQVNHINAIKDDNRIENLEWCTNQENRNHAVKNKLQPLQFGIKNPNVKLDPVKVLRIRQLKKSGLSSNEISKIIGTSKSNVENIIRGRTWKWLKDGEKRFV